METLTTTEQRITNGGQLGLEILRYSNSIQLADGPVYADGTGSGYPGEVWFP